MSRYTSCSGKLAGAILADRAVCGLHVLILLISPKAFWIFE